MIRGQIVESQSGRGGFRGRPGNPRGSHCAAVYPASRARGSDYGSGSEGDVGSRTDAGHGTFDCRINRAPEVKRHAPIEACRGLRAGKSSCQRHECRIVLRNGLSIADAEALAHRYAVLPLQRGSETLRAGWAVKIGEAAVSALRNVGVVEEQTVRSGIQKARGQVLAIEN